MKIIIEMIIRFSHLIETGLSVDFLQFSCPVYLPPQQSSSYLSLINQYIDH